MNNKTRASKEWPCMHIEKYDNKTPWTNFSENFPEDVPKKWNFCPICGATRPKTTKPTRQTT